MQQKSVDRPATLRERLAELTFREARDLLGPQGGLLLRECDVPEDFNPRTDLYFDANLLQLTLRECDPMSDVLFCEDVVVSVSLDNTTSDTAALGHTALGHAKLHCLCSACSRPERTRTGCPHVATTLSLILDEKQMLGLVDPPDLDTPLEQLTEEQLLERALFERRRRAETEPFLLEESADTHGDPATPWADYRVRSERSGHSYRVALRGEERGESYCNCPDFRTNTLGTCKHVEFALNTLRKRFSRSAFRKPYKNDSIFVHVRYDVERTLRLVLPDDATNAMRAAAKKFLDRPINDVRGLVKLIARLDQAGFPVTIYPDAEEMIARELYRLSTAEKIAAIRENPAAHPLRTTLLKEELLPYQLDGIAFVVGAGRAILADETGLGKSVQAIGAAELLARFAEAQRVLVVCSAGRKSHWKHDLHRFSRRPAVFIGEKSGTNTNSNTNSNGNSNANPAPGKWGKTFFTVCTYEQLLADTPAALRVRWDLIILDDGERLYDWESKTARMLKEIDSPFALLLTDGLSGCGIEELFSIVQFVDDRRLPPAFRFFHQHRTVDETGVPTGYKGLATLRKAIEPILLRRTRKAVLKELPPRSTRIISIPMRPDQTRVHDAEIARAVHLLGRARLTEIDMLRIRKHLLAAQRACDGIDLEKHPDVGGPMDGSTEGTPPKIESLLQLLKGPFADETRTIAVFSEWDSMLDRVETALKADAIAFVRLNEKEPQKKRQAAANAFHKSGGSGDCRIILATSEAVRGLHLHGVDTLVHLDMPWKTAVLERRIESVESGPRKKTRQALQMFLFLSEHSLEERLLDSSHGPSIGASDPSFSGTDFAQILLDPAFDLDSLPLEAEDATFRRQLLALLGPFAAPTDAVSASAKSSKSQKTDREAAVELEHVAEFLASHLEVGETGRRRLVVELGPEESLDTLAALIRERMKKNGNNG